MTLCCRMRAVMMGTAQPETRRTRMRHKDRLLGNALLISLFLSFIGIGTSVEAQGRMTIQATAAGTSTQMGKLFNVNIHIEQYSTPADQKALVEAFSRSG